MSQGRRESLRELQTRLAQRLQAAREQPRPAGWLAVHCGGARLLLPLAQAGEILSSATWRALPHTQAWFRGVTSLRGRVLGVVDLGLFLGTAGAADTRGGTLIALNASLGMNTALRVDRLAGLRPVDLPESPEPVAPGRPDFAGALRRDVDGQDWQEIDLAALAASPAFLNIARAAPDTDRPSRLP
jgi:twitching motility protein PilI